MDGLGRSHVPQPIIGACLFVCSFHVLFLFLSRRSMSMPVLSRLRDPDTADKAKKSSMEEAAV